MNLISVLMLEDILSGHKKLFIFFIHGLFLTLSLIYHSTYHLLIL